MVVEIRGVAVSSSWNMLALGFSFEIHILLQINTRFMDVFEYLSLWRPV